MSFQAYLDTIKEKTGLDPDDFRRLATEKGLIKHGDIVAWAKGELGLGHGHANAIAAVLLKSESRAAPAEDKLGKHFSGKKAIWQEPVNDFLHQIKAFGDDVQVSPNESYINLNKGVKKFGILQVSTERLDVGIKLKGLEPTGRLEVSGTWNAMVTYRVRVADSGGIDAELLNWLKAAYDAA